MQNHQPKLGFTEILNSYEGRPLKVEPDWPGNFWVSNGLFDLLQYDCPIVQSNCEPVWLFQLNVY